MILSEMVKHINLVTDEEFDFEQVVAFINDAVAKINTECGSSYPFFDVLQPNFVHPLPVKYQRSLFVPFAAGRIKENDSSQFEYEDWYGQFFDNLKTFQDKYEIPEEFQDEDYNSGSYWINFNNNPYGGEW